MMRIYSIVITVMLLGGCAHVSSPERPPNVPASAVWSGGPDGGNWFDCDTKQDSEYNHCMVYADVTGIVLESGRYQLRNEKRAATKNELQYAYYSEGEIYLKNKKTLIRIAQLGDGVGSQ
jgi:hypothetical protein